MRIAAMAAGAVGGYFGVGWAKMLPDKIVRAVVVAIGAALTVIFFVRP